MAEQGVRVQVEHARGGDDLVLIAQDEGIDFQKPRIALSEKRVAGLERHRRAVEALAVHAHRAQKRDAPLLAQAVQDIDFETLEGFGVIFQERLDLHAALGAEHDERPARCAVESDREIPLLRNRDSFLHQQAFDGKMVHDAPQEFPGRFFRRIRRIRSENRPRLAALSGGHQGLHHHGAAYGAHGFCRFPRRSYRASLGDAHARIAQKRFGPVLEHAGHGYLTENGRSAFTGWPRGGRANPCRRAP